MLRSRWLTMGAVTQKFEAEVAAYTGAKHAIAVTNATAALHLACLAAGLGPGDEVILPSLTFVATANAVRYTGAIPVFADIAGPDNLNLSPAVDRGRHHLPHTRHPGGALRRLRLRHARHPRAGRANTAWPSSKMPPTPSARSWKAARWGPGARAAVSASSPTRT